MRTYLAGAFLLSWLKLSHAEGGEGRTAGLRWADKMESVQFQPHAGEAPQVYPPAWLLTI